MERIDQGRPISHVAAEAGVSRQRLGEWYRRWRQFGEAGLLDRSSTPISSPNQLAEHVGDQIEELRRRAVPVFLVKPGDPNLIQPIRPSHHFTPFKNERTSRTFSSRLATGVDGATGNVFGADTTG